MSLLFVIKAAWSEDFVAVKAHGAVCDGRHDDTAALAESILAAQTSAPQGQGSAVILPVGICLTAPLQITGQLTLRGVSSYASVLKLKSGSNAPVLTVNMAGAHYPAAGFPAAHVNIESLRITSEDGKGAPHDAASGIRLVGKAVSTWVNITDVTIWNVPGSALVCEAFRGLARVVRADAVNNGGDGLRANSCVDWRIMDSTFEENGGRGISLSGCGSFEVFATDTFTNERDGVYVFGLTTLRWFGGILDHNGGFGLVAQDTAAGSVLMFSGAAISGNGSRAPHRQGQIHFDAGSGLFECRECQIILDAAPTAGDALAITFDHDSHVAVSGDFLVPSALKGSTNLPIKPGQGGATFIVR